MGFWRGRSSRKQRRPDPFEVEQSNVPKWEKDFCRAVSRMSWGDIVLKKKMMRFNCPRVIEWDDSAGEEAFHNAKARYWAKKNGLPCDIPCPESDTYIDDVDWNSEIDIELLKDLDECRLQSDVDEDVQVCASASQLTIGWDYPPPCTGWGDAEEPIQPTGWGDAEETVQPTGWGDTTDANQPFQPTGWVDTTNTPQPTRWDDTEAGDVVLQTGWGNDGRQLYSGKFRKVPQNNDRDGPDYGRRKNHGSRNRASGGGKKWEEVRHHRVAKWEWRPVGACNT